MSPVKYCSSITRKNSVIGILLLMACTLPVNGVWPLWNPPDRSTTVSPPVDDKVSSPEQAVASSTLVPPPVPIICTTPAPVLTTQRYNPNRAGDVLVPGSFASPRVRLGVVLAQELLRLFMHYTTARFKRDMSRDIKPLALVRDSLKFCLLAYMGYHKEQECIERAACEAGELMSRYIPGMPLMFVALDYIVPGQYRPLVRLAKDAAEGNVCVYYRCGVLPYVPDRPQ
ncbi:uncharacterized protein [Procambarus clarkii]|uniref:uncharacterized protein n=1 Tax=Procambarus clarkii TaxID=6728 RepID=UPI0037443287